MVCWLVCKVDVACIAEFVFKGLQIGDHALPQRGFGLSTPSGAQREGVTPSNTGRRRQR
jgi:hypothetical protein